MLNQSPEHPEALELLVDAARASRDPAASLHEALTRGAAAQPAPERAVALWREAATVAEADLKQPEQAIADLERLIDIDDSDDGAWQKLMSLLTAAGDYEKLAAR